MKLVKYLAVLVVFALSMYGCGSSGGGGGKDASESCEDLCDRVDKCAFEGFDKGLCNDICDEIDDEEGEVDSGCEDAIIDLFDCGEKLSCEELATLDFEGIDEFLFSVLEEFEACFDEVDDLIDECEDDFGEDG